MALHEVQLKGYSVRPGNLSLGTFDSYGIEQLHVTLDDTWSGLAIDATFHNTPSDKGVTMLVDADGLVPVPPEACKQPSKYATITFRGVQDGVQRISCNLPYMVLDHGQVPGANSTATPSENAQALAQMQGLRDGAVDAKNQAEAARDDAAKSAVASKESETNASQSATAAKTAQKAAASSASSASTSASTATTQAAAAKSSATTAKASEAAAGKSAKEAAASAANLDSAVNTATQKAAAASASAEAAKASESAAASSEAAARKYANSAELAAKTAGEAAAEKLQQMQAIQGDVTDKQAQTATDATAAEKAKVAAEAAQKDAAASKAAAANSSAAAKTSEDAAAKSAADADSTANSIKESMTQIAALQKRQNVLVGSEIGNPASCDDAFAAPLCGLTVYGKSTHDGTPTPDAPVPIVSAGDGGTIVLTLGDGDGKTQTLTLPTPNGLPGIPVASGGNYTDPQGQNWVCDEVDLERGVKVQRVNAVDLSTCVITGTTNLAATKRLAIRLPLKGKDYTAKALCNRLPYLASFTSDTIHFYVDTNNAQVFIPIGAKNPEEGEYILFYVLDAPIETPLTPAEIAAYKAITAYAPDTVVQASDDAGVKLEYQRDVNLVVKNLEDAIASMTTT